MIRRTLIQQLFMDHASSLQAFFRGRLRARHEAADLTQEVYMRLLRAQDKEILNPEAYLFTIANNLLKERSVMSSRERARVDLTDPTAIEALQTEALLADTDPVHGVHLQAQIQGLRTVLPELSARCQLVLVLAFDEELSQHDIAVRLGVSKTMVRKLLAQAIGHCRKRLLALENV